MYVSILSKNPVLYKFMMYSLNYGFNIYQIDNLVHKG